MAEANTALSVANWHEATRVPAALGLDPAVAQAVNAVVTHAGGWEGVACGLGLELGLGGALHCNLRQRS